MLAISLGNIITPETYAIAFPIYINTSQKMFLFCPTPTLQKKDKSQNFSLKFTFLSLCNQLVRANIITRDNSQKVLLYYGTEKKRVADR